MNERLRFQWNTWLSRYAEFRHLLIQLFIVFGGTISSKTFFFLLYAYSSALFYFSLSICFFLSLPSCCFVFCRSVTPPEPLKPVIRNKGSPWYCLIVRRRVADCYYVRIVRNCEIFIHGVHKGNFAEVLNF